MSAHWPARRTDTRGSARRQAVSIPVAIKISPFFSSMSNMAKRLDDAGADGLVLFNRFYQPDFDLDELRSRVAEIATRTSTA